MPSTINGKTYQHAYLGIVMTGMAAPVVLGGFTKIEYKVSAARKPVRDSNGKIVGWTRSEEETSSSLEMHFADWIAMKRRLYALFPGLGILDITIPTLVISMGNAQDSLITEKLMQFGFNEDARTSDSSQDPHKVAAPFFFTKLIDSEGREPVSGLA